MLKDGLWMKSISARCCKRLLIACMLLLAPTGVASASSITYTYVGSSPFQSYACGGPCPHLPTGSGPLNISFTLPTALAPNLGTPGNIGVYGSYTTFYAVPVPGTFSATDGYWHIDQTNYTALTIGVVTDSSGNISQWSINVGGPQIAVNCGGTCVYTETDVQSSAYYTGGIEDASNLITYGFCGGFQCNLLLYTTPAAGTTSPLGTWTITGGAPPPAPVPEPASIVLLGTGLLAVARGARRKWHK